jgi:hypothetical protein
MRIELELDGDEVEFVGLNLPNAAASQQDLVDVCSFPLWQDQAEVGVVGALGLRKDDLLVLDRTGVVVALLGRDGLGPVNLSTPEGYALLKEAISSVP